jgi:hypothetical protein
MNNKILAILIVCLFTLIGISGCTEQQGTKENSDLFTIGMTDTISVNSTGGTFFMFDDNLQVNVPSESVSQQVDITLTTIQTPVEDSSLVFLTCFHCEPDGLTFLLPIEVIIHYNVNELPEGVNESAIKCYVLTNATWEPIEGSYANQIMHYVTAQVSHFSQMAFCSFASATEDTDDDSDDESEDDDDQGNSSQYWFKADMYFYDFKTPRLVDSDHDDTYTVGVSAYWDPVSYVQYYQIKFEFHGNLPKDYGWGCDFREQGKYYCLPSASSLKEGYIYRLGGDPNLEGFLTLYDASEVATANHYNQSSGKMEYVEYGRVRPKGAHGFGFMGVYDTVEDSEGFSDITLGTMVGEMQTYVKAYVNGWDVWVRGVTERGD